MRLWIFFIATMEVLQTCIGCRNTDNCVCLSNRNELEFQWPPFSNPVTKDGRNAIEIHCYDNHRTESELTTINSHHTLLKFRFCQIPSNFISVLNRYTQNKLSALVFSNSNLSGIILNKEYFKGLDNLTNLDLSANSIVEIDDDAFFNLVRLRLLILNQNNIILKPDLFKGLSNLSTLEIGENQLTDLPEGLFTSLKKLEILNLWKNNLKYLKNDAFAGLTNLVCLELSGNGIINIPENAFRDLSNLSRINLSRNKLTNIADNLFKSNKALQLVRMANNPELLLPKHLFSNLEELQEVVLDNCNLDKIPENIFQVSQNLSRINLSRNKLTNITDNLFKSNKALQLVRMANNPELLLPKHLFSNLEELQEVVLDNCNLEEIPENIFQGSQNLSKLSLRNNSLRVLSSNMFKDLKHLSELLLSENFIENITFLSADLEHLKQLDLKSNLIANIAENVFKPLKNLEILNLEANRIKHIHTRAFYRNEQLIELYLDRNEYLPSMGTLLENCINLKIVNVSYNRIENIKAVIDLTNKLKLQKLDFSHNNIGYIQVSQLQVFGNNEVEIHLQHNKIKVVDVEGIEQIVYNILYKNKLSFRNASSVIYLNNNPVLCNCQNYDLWKYLNHITILPTVRVLFNIIADNLKCYSDPNYEFKTMPMDYFTCVSCPDKCFCQYRPNDTTVIVECQDANFTEIPRVTPPIIRRPFLFKDIPEILPRSQIELHLENNNIWTVAPPYNSTNYDLITKLYLSNNLIANITRLPANVQILTLDKNKLKHLDYTVLDQLNKSSVKNLTLNGNPWICDCTAANLTNFLHQHANKKVPTDEIRCDNSTTLLRDLSRTDLCQEWQMVSLVLPIVCILLFVAEASALYCRYQQEVKVWLFAKNLCLWWVTEEELDKDKIYDAFISYSHKDEDFVTQNVLPVLEGGSRPYKLCLHYRDWVPGEFISTQITKSVNDSKRTLIILSPSFLESVWGKMEFRTAHTNAMSEGRARVIVVLYGDINVASLDNELMSYLKTNTYLQWGDPYFWNKLRYALPHSNKNIIKHANVVSCIDDKFNLVSLPNTSNSDSIPPVFIRSYTP